MTTTNRATPSAQNLYKEMHFKTEHNFHGYIVQRDSIVLGKKGNPLAVTLRPRNGGGFDKRVNLTINGRGRYFTLSRLMAQCFLGPVYGLEVNHKNRDTMRCELENLEISTRSANQVHWREDQKRKRVQI